MNSPLLMKLLLVPLAVLALRMEASACACGCGVFDVGTGAMLPGRAGGMAYLGYGYQDQNQNWNGTASASADSNEDKEISTHFLTVGLQYFFNRSWGLKAEAPYWFRSFKTEDGSVRFNELGDARIRGEYTGFSEDLSMGVDLGVKLPTGGFKQEADAADRDTQIGSGSTDVLAGGFFRHALTPGNRWTWMAMASIDVPFLSQGGYLPGSEFNESIGLVYNTPMWGGAQIKPLAMVIGSERLHDTGPNSAHPIASGYQRVLLSPGLEVHLHAVKLFADLEWPVFQNVLGNQLAAPVLVKTTLATEF
jgi:hypothetical protein